MNDTGTRRTIYRRIRKINEARPLTSRGKRRKILLNLTSYNYSTINKTDNGFEVSGKNVASYLKVSKATKQLNRVFVSSLNIYISDDTGLFTVPKFTNCGKFRCQIDIIRQTHSYLKSAITLCVKDVYLVAL